MTESATRMFFPRVILSAEVQGLLRRFWGIAQARPLHVALPLGLVLIATAVEGASYGLLIPLSDAMSENGFDFLTGSRFFGWMAALAPESAMQSPKRDGYLALVVLSLVVGGRIAKVLIDFGRQRYTHQRDEAYHARIREQAFRRVLSFGRLYFDRQSVGRIDTELSWATSPVVLLASGEELLRRVLAVVAKAAVMVLLSPVLFITTIVAYPAIQVAMRRIHTAVADLAGQNANLERQMRGEVLDLLSTIPLVKALSQETEAAASYAVILDESRDLSVRRRNMMALRWPSEEILVLGTILVAQAAIIVTADVFRPGDLARLAAFLLLVQQTLPDLKKYGEFRLAIAEQTPKLEALVELFRDEGKHIVTSGNRTFAGLTQGVQLRGLSFAYWDGTTVLRDISVDIPAGKMTALVGESGAGKTTLVDVLARFYECPRDTVFLDGVDIRDFSLESLYGRMAIVSQDVWLLNRSLRENLVFGLEAPPSDEVLMELLEDLRFQSLLAESEKPLDLQIGDRGVQLSGGQRQRLALARAILRDPDILVLDEATSALDSVVEARVEEIIERRSLDRTLIVIAHRLSTIRRADQILVLKEGRVVERGRWNELVAMGGEFARLHEAQFQERLNSADQSSNPGS